MKQWLSMLITLAFALAALAGLWLWWSDPIERDDARQIATGARLYAEHCATCHGADLEGQANWRERRSDGKLPAPPHDETGHTWHHPDDVLFAITKNGLVWPQAPKGYESDMPAFAETLSDEEIWAVLAYIKSHWNSTDVLKARKEMTRNIRQK